MEEKNVLKPLDIVTTEATKEKFIHVFFCKALNHGPNIDLDSALLYF